MNLLIWLSLLGVLLGYLVARRIGWFAPLTVAIWFLVGVFILSMISGLRLAEINLQTAAIVAVGLVGLAVPALLARRRAELIGVRPAPDPCVALPRVIICAAILTGLVIVGFLSFRSRISGATGISFGNLTVQQIRAAQNGAARGGGFLALSSAAAPILSCLGVYAARLYSRWWYLATVLSFAALLDSPARTSVLALGVTTLVFWLYLRRQSAPQMKARSTGSRRGYVLLLVAVALAAMLYYFLHTGSAAKKTQEIAAAYPYFGGPDWIISPILYFTGGLSALSVAVHFGFDPFDHPASIYSLVKLGNAIDPNLHVPDTIARYIQIPAPFNVYTGFGQLYFDFGFTGVFVLCGILGWFCIASHRRALAGKLEWMFLSAIAANVLASMPLEYRLFLLDVDFEIILGIIVFAFVGRGRSRHQTGGEIRTRLTNSPGPA